jgi:hypothetical protein
MGGEVVLRNAFQDGSGPGQGRRRGFLAPVLRATLGWVILLSSGAGARCESDWDFRGYYKNLATASYIEPGGLGETAGSAQTRWDDYQRLRFKLEGVGDAWSSAIHYEWRALWGSSAGAGSQDAEWLWTNRRRFCDLDSEIVAGSDLAVDHGLDRLAFTVFYDDVTLSLGRQSVTWGSALIWSPVDLFSAFSPNEIDRDEKPGVDVVRLTLTFAGDSSIDLVAEPLDLEESGSADRDSACAVRAQTLVGEYDVAVCGGYVASDKVAGCDFAGYVGNAGLRGELLYTRVDGDSVDDYFRGTLSADYGFQAAWQPYVAVEYYHSGFGSDDEDGYIELVSRDAVQRLFARGTAFNLGRDYMGLMVRLTPSALTSVQSQTIVNIGDGSAREYVSGSLSVSENADLIAGANIGLGSGGSELGSGHLFYTYLKLYF